MRALSTDEFYEKHYFTYIEGWRKFDTQLLNFREKNCAIFHKKIVLSLFFYNLDIGM